MGFYIAWKNKLECAGNDYSGASNRRLQFIAAL